MAAAVLVAGGDPWQMLNMQDQTEFLIMDVIIDRAWELQSVRDKNLAAEIANKLGKILR